MREGTKLVGIRDRVMRVDALSVRLDSRHRMESAAEQRCKRRLPVDAHDPSLDAPAATRGDGEPEPGDALGTVERPDRSDGFATAGRDECRVGRKEVLGLVSVAGWSL